MLNIYYISNGHQSQTISKPTQRLLFIHGLGLTAKPANWQNMGTWHSSNVAKHTVPL